MANKYVYLFGTRKSEGDKEMKNLLGGKGANLAEMASACRSPRASPSPPKSAPTITITKRPIPAN